MGDEQRASNSEQSVDKNEDEPRTRSRTSLEWAQKSESEQVILIEKAFWQWHGNQYPTPTLQKPPSLGKPPTPWRIEVPDILQVHEPGYLCEACRYVDFKYLINSSWKPMREDITLASLSWHLNSRECAFCRLIISTLNDALDGRPISPQVDGKDVICALTTLPLERDTSGQCQICLLTLPPPEGIDGSSNLKFYSFSPQDDIMVDQTRGRSIQSAQMNIELIRKWYRGCFDGNCGSNSSRNFCRKLPPGFRLIDVHRYCMVESEDNVPYVALSYVWGAARTMRNMQDIRRDLEVDGSLLEKMNELPNTIKDAISLTKEVGERYLWVDSLCIIQDDPEDVKVQIAAMDQIFSSATLTIAAASGNAAGAGLPGMSAGPRTFQQHIEKVQGIYLASRAISFFSIIDESPWNSRAWTLQERVMSTRILYTGQQRCFFSCQHRQDVFMESDDVIENGLQKTSKPTVFKDQTANMMPSSSCVNIISYRRVVEAYTSRQLSFASDMLNAFEGMASRLRPLFRSDLLFGLPRSELDSQILWQPSGPITRRHDPNSGLPIFPSWSWVGWVGPVKCNIDESLSRIEWIETSGERYLGRDFRYPTGANKDVIKRIGYRMQWIGALENGVPYYFEQTNPDAWFLHPTAPEDERIVGPNLKRGTDHLIFEAETTRLPIIGFGHYLTMAIWNHKCTKDTHTVCPLPLRDAEGFIGGYFMVPGEVSATLNTEASYECVMISRSKTFQQKSRGEGNPDLLVDSEATTMEKAHFPDRPNINTDTEGCGFDQQRYDAEKPWCVYNIMLVEWKGEVAYRLGVGRMHIDAWAQANPKRKQIVLG